MSEESSYKYHHKDHGASGAVVLFFIFLFVFAKWGPAIPFSVLSQSKGEPMVVTGSGKAVVVPDIAKINAGIEEQGTTLKQVQDSVNKKSQSLVAVLKGLGIEERDIKTTAYNVYPQSDYQTKPAKVIGYQVSINYEITVRNIDKVNDVLVAVTPSGANLVGGVSFDLSDTAREKAMNEARVDAVKTAKQSAEGLAKTAGVTLGKVINVSESQGFNPRPIYMAAGNKAVSLDAAAPVSPEVEPGTTEINLTVSLSYEVR